MCALRSSKSGKLASACHSRRMNSTAPMNTMVRSSLSGRYEARSGITKCASPIEGAPVSVRRQTTM